MSKTLPYVEVSGSYQQIGETIGTKFRDQIQNSIKLNREQIPDYVQTISKCSPYIEATKKYIPHLLTEAESIARSANVSFEEYFLINNREVYDASEAIDLSKETNLDHCTVVAGFGQDGLVVGHNEDWAIDAIDKTYILKATIGNTSFIGFNYQVTIPGIAASMNNHGLVQCINDLYQTNQIGVPKNFIARAVLECKTLNEAEELIRNTPRASGFNHVLACRNEIRNVELAGSRMSVERIIEKPYAHTNHYLSPEMKLEEKFHTINSEARLQRAYELLKNDMNKEEILNILKDTNNKKYPICRPNETIGSAVFTPQSHTAYFCYGHPCAGEFQKNTL